MSEDFQTPKEYQHPNPKNNNLLLWGIIALLVVAGGYFFIQKNKVSQEKADTELRLEEVNIEKESLSKEYNAAIARLDEMTSENASMDSLLKSQGGEIVGLKDEIKRILSDKNATQGELKKAKNMIAQLEELVTQFQAQINALKQENIELVHSNRELTESKKTTELENESLKETKKELEETVELGTVLSATNIEMTVINQKKNLFGKEVNKTTTKAKKADMLEVNFSLAVNRLTESGEKTIFIVVKNPQGNIIHSKGNASGTIDLAEGGKQEYTTKKIVPYTRGRNSMNISANCVPADAFEAGVYTVELYNKGYLIGQDNITLR